MQKFILSKDHLYELITENRYAVKDTVKSRCIDGRYAAKENLPALAYPGADAGLFLTILSSGHEYGFDVDLMKSWETLVSSVGGEQALSFHTDTHSKDTLFGGCGHVREAFSHPSDYDLGLDAEQIVHSLFRKALDKGAVETVLAGEHDEGAVVLVRGNYGIYPRFTLMDQGHPKQVSIFVFHQTLVDARHRQLASMLIENKAVDLPDGCDDEYLYEVFSEVSENHLLETTKRLGKGLPIYEVLFDEGGTFEIIEMGEV
jgi:hypothetical protein